jgi:hypothetical protein
MSFFGLFGQEPETNQAGPPPYQWAETPTGRIKSTLVIE